MTVQIHHVKTRSEERWVLDPVVGPSRKSVAIPEMSDTDRIVHSLGTFEVQADGTFHVPEQIADELTKTPHWHRGLPPFPPEPEPTPARGPSKPRKVTEV